MKARITDIEDKTQYDVACRSECHDDTDRSAYDALVALPNDHCILMGKVLVERVREFAWFHLNRLCGCNYQQPIQRKGRYIWVTDPQHPNTRYRLDATKFDAGRAQFRESWAIEPWDSRARETVEAERNWQT
ncbi:MAG TPA: hypothetical protein VMX94_03510 [Armatimonadota bacterium]|nr:hypothetical protein [Armatimonadota bacterium]